MLKTACRARSEVGRVSSPSGAASLTPLWLPASIRIANPGSLGRRFECGLRLLFGFLAEAELFFHHLARHFLDLSLFEMAELERTVGEADEATDRPAEMTADVADLAVLALGQGHGQPGIVALLPVEARMDRAVADALDGQALAHLVEMLDLDLAVHPHAIAPNPPCGGQFELARQL